MKFDKDKYIDGYMKTNLDLLMKAVNMKWDGVIYVSGFEGDGKTTLAAQVCYYLDRTFCLDRVVFTPDQFQSACLNAKKKQAILFDESYMTFNSRMFMNKATNTIISMLTMIRKKQLFIIIVAPTFFDITKYIAIHRSRALIHVYSKGLERGFFTFYNRERKLELYIKGRRDHNMRVTKPNFIGSFTKWFPLEDEDYQVKKDESIRALQKSAVPIIQCPECEGQSSRWLEIVKKMVCRKCGFRGTRTAFINKLR